MSGIVGTSHSKSKIIGRSQDIVKTWINFDGTGTVSIRGSFNVSSLTDYGTGFYYVNYITPMALHGASVVSNRWHDIRGGTYASYNHTTYMRCIFMSAGGSTYIDCDSCQVIVFGD